MLDEVVDDVSSPSVEDGYALMLLRSAERNGLVAVAVLVDDAVVV